MAPRVGTMPSVLTESPGDVRLLEIFLVKCIPIIPGYFTSKIYTFLVPQLGHTEPAILHAMLAIASLHEATEALGRPVNNTAQNSTSVSISRPEACAMAHYSKALRGLQQHLSSRTSSAVVVLTACLLFICLESLRGHSEAALAHIDNGLNILKDYYPKYLGGTSSDQVKPTQYSTSDAMDMLCNAFMRMRLLSLSIKEQTQPAKLKAAATAGPIVQSRNDYHLESMDEARAALGPILNNAASVISDAMQEDDGRSPDFPGPDAAVTRRARVEAQLRHWSRAFEVFIKNNPRYGKHGKADQSMVGALILKIYAKVFSIRLWISYIPQGPDLDDLLLTDFKELLELAEECTVVLSQSHTSFSGEKKQHPVFIMDMGIIPALFFTACRCPDITMRWRAIAMLEQTPRREALWCSMDAARTARSLMASESGQAISAKTRVVGIV